MPDDARLLELTWLTELEQGPKRVGPFGDDSPERRLAVYLLRKAFVNDQSQHRRLDDRFDALDYQAKNNENQRGSFIASLMGGSALELRISHEGAVRRAELEQQLKTGRIKEPMGLIWDGRHFRQDTRIALLDASTERPLSVAFLDLNDVKAFNEKGHPTGDEAIKRYLEIVADVVADRGDAYRLSGGADEVIILLPRRALSDSVSLIKVLLAELGRQVVADLTLRAAAGLVIATDPAESVDGLKARADAEQQRAKDASRGEAGRPSYLAAAGASPERV